MKPLGGVWFLALSAFSLSFLVIGIAYYGFTLTMFQTWFAVSMTVSSLRLALKALAEEDTQASLAHRRNQLSIVNRAVVDTAAERQQLMEDECKHKIYEHMKEQLRQTLPGGTLLKESIPVPQGAVVVDSLLDPEIFTAEASCPKCHVFAFHDLLAPTGDFDVTRHCTNPNCNHQWGQRFSAIQ